MQTNPFQQAFYQRRSEGAIRYSRTDKSDPHSYKRAMSHTYTGIAAVGRSEDNRVVTAYYDADTFSGHRDPDPRWDGLKPLREKMGLRPLERVDCTAYRNVVRP